MVKKGTILHRNISLNRLSETNDSGRKGQLGPGKRLLYLKKRK
jgi:hypothetical protein